MTKKLKKNKININKIFSKKEHRKKLIIYITLRILVIICMIAEILHGDLNNVLLCILTLILFTLPDFISNKFEVDLPDTLEIITYLFIFAAEILGEIQRFFLIFPMNEPVKASALWSFAWIERYASAPLFTKSASDLTINGKYVSKFVK